MYVIVWCVAVDDVSAYVHCLHVCACFVFLTDCAVGSLQENRYGV